MLVQDSVFALRLRRDKRGRAEFSSQAGLPALSNPLCGSQTAGILLVVEDLKRGTNPAEKGGRPKDIFEIASNFRLARTSALAQFSDIPHSEGHLFGVKIFGQRNDVFAGDTGHFLKLRGGNFFLGLKKFH